MDQRALIRPSLQIEIERPTRLMQPTQRAARLISDVGHVKNETINRV